MSEPAESPIPRCVYLMRDNHTFLFFDGLTVDQAIEAIRHEDAYWMLFNKRNGTYMHHIPGQTWEPEAHAILTEPLKERRVKDRRVKGRRTEVAESFRDAVIDALVNIHSYTTEHDTDPRKAIADLIEIETNIALDPAVSSEARALIERGRKEVPSSWKCSVHGPGKREVWGCPDCVWELKRQNARLWEALEHMARQHCTTTGSEHKEPYITSSGGLSANAEALEVLAEEERFRIARECGRVVVGYWPENDPAARTALGGE